MVHVGFLPHRDLPEALTVARGGEDWLAAHGHSSVILGKQVDSTLYLDTLDLLVGLGGDGTMLRAMELAHRLRIPVIGVNLGRLGYLTEVDPSGLNHALERFFSGTYKIEERMALEVTVEGSLHTALNEVVLEKIQPGHTVLISVSIAGRHFLTYAADGLVICTATGSTAYNLSIRGPILSPRLKAMVVTPISPHMLFDRPLVLEPSEEVSLRIDGSRPATVLVDGTTVADVVPGTELHCRASVEPVRVVKMDGTDLRSVLKDKFGLMDR
ncbi:MAG: NAD(+)/NADH kinase [Actinobacteria bacterium]|jgi:NAD+ kinase|nr:NAD(+)/NADH kinase [Actinomycetota bacterium]